MRNTALIYIVFAIIWFLPWTNEYDTRRTLKFSGYTDIQIGGHSFFACPSDWSATEFLATNPIGIKRVPPPKEVETGGVLMMLLCDKDH